MTPVLALGQGALFAIGSVVFIAVFVAALGLGYARFEELGENDRSRGVLTEPRSGLTRVKEEPDG